MGIIRRHAGSMHRLVNGIPPRPSCVFPVSARKPLGAWFAKTPDASASATTRECINAPDVSLAFYMLYGERPRDSYSLDRQYGRGERALARLCCVYSMLVPSINAGMQQSTIPLVCVLTRLCVPPISFRLLLLTMAMQAPRATRLPLRRTWESPRLLSPTPGPSVGARCRCSPPRQSAACPTWVPTRTAAPVPLHRQRSATHHHHQSSRADV